MTEFAAAYSFDNEANALIDDCVEQLRGASAHNLGFLYVTDALAGDLAAITSSLRARTGVAHWVGTVGVGVCATGNALFDRPAISILTCACDAAFYRIIPSLSTPESIRQAYEPDVMAALGVVHADPRNPHTSGLITGLAQASETYLIGGLTAAESQFLQVADDVTEGGVSGVLLGGEMQVAVGLTQGCSPIGPAHVITGGDRNIVAMLDDRPAFEILCEDLGVADGVDPRPWLTNIHAALLVTGADTGDYLVRNLIGIDPTQGLVAVADEVALGSRIVFVRRDAHSAAKDLGRMLANLESRITVAPKAGLYFSCVARGPNLFDEDGHELEAIRQTFGDIPVAGFFGNGEISNDRVYGYTGVLALFS